jgi:hypothetical protein
MGLMGLKQSQGMRFESDLGIEKHYRRYDDARVA